MTREEIQTPCLLIRLDLVRKNIARMAELVGGDMRRWRPHIKTAKIPEVLSLLMHAGVRRFKCATSREALVLLRQAKEPIDLLIALSHRGPNLDRIGELAKQFPEHSLSVLSEEPGHAAQLGSTGLGVYLDLDPGYQRSGIPLPERERIAATAKAAGPSLRGLHLYDGHLHDCSPRERDRVCQEIYGQLIDCATYVNLPDGEMVTSGTPTFPNALGYRSFGSLDHSISPGTVIYWDLRSDELDISGFQCAALVQSRVISRPASDRVTCDAGSKALDAAAGDPCAQATNWDGLQALTPSEEHLPLRILSGKGPPLGHLLLLAPRHVCPTVNLADQAVLLEGEEVIDIVPVAARGHETSVPGIFRAD